MKNDYQTRFRGLCVISCRDCQIFAIFVGYPVEETDRKPIEAITLRRTSSRTYTQATIERKKQLRKLIAEQDRLRK